VNPEAFPVDPALPGAGFSLAYPSVDVGLAFVERGLDIGEGREKAARRDYPEASENLPNSGEAAIPVGIGVIADYGDFSVGRAEGGHFYSSAVAFRARR